MNAQFSDQLRLCFGLARRTQHMKGTNMKKKPLPNDKGQVLIFVTLAFVVLGMFVGLAVDGGRAYLMKERLRSIVDAAALAGAKAMAGPSDPIQAQEAARTAACDSAKVNGLDAGSCDSEKLNVEIGPAPDGTLGVIVTGTDTSRTFFMALGGLIGCDSCKTINVAHTGIAVPDTLVDVVLVMDDTGTMSNGCTNFTEPSCPIAQAKAGAVALVDILLADPKSHAKIAFVPFRGCYATESYTPDPSIGCILFTDIQDLTNNRTALTTKINARQAKGGYPGTNVCLAMHQGRKKLFSSESRAIARKVMVLLTDGDQTYSDGASGNLGIPITPRPYPTSPYIPLSGQSGADAGHEPEDAAQSVPGSCMSTNPPGNLAFPADRSTYNAAINSLDVLANAKATTLKKTDPSGVNIETYVLRFAYPVGDALASGDPAGSCDPSLFFIPGPDRGGPPDDVTSNEIRDRNLSRCLASNTAMGDPFAVTANDHYFYAATAADITARFTAIASNILRKRRLVA
jgi:Flp pilus assembly protein TadG